MLATGGAQAHSLESQSNSGASVPQWAAKRLDYLPSDRALVSRSAAPGLEYVVVLPNKWAQKQSLRVCFVGGNDMLRARILLIASVWIDKTNLPLDAGGPNGRTCGNLDASEIRIGFNEPGYWSYIGNDSLSEELVSNGLTSMNFQGFDVNPPGVTPWGFITNTRVRLGAATRNTTGLSCTLTT